jgi:hypothetical protein
MTEIALALFASIHINQGMAALKDLPSKVETLRRSLPPGEVPKPIPAAIVENYMTDGYFQEIETGLYIFKPPAEVAGAKTPDPTHMVVFDVNLGLIYYAGAQVEKGPVFRVTFSDQVAAKAVELPPSQGFGYGAYYPEQRLQQFPKPPSIPTFAQNPAPVPTGPSSSAIVPFGGGGPVGPVGGGGGPGNGSGNGLTKERACQILGLNPTLPLTASLVNTAFKRAHPDHGASDADFDQKFAAYKFLKNTFKKLEETTIVRPAPVNLPNNSPFRVANTVVGQQMQNPLFLATLSQELTDTPPRGPEDFETIVEKACDKFDAVSGAPPVPDATRSDLTAAFQAIPLSYTADPQRSSDIADQLVDTFATQIPATAPPTQDYTDDRLRALLDVDTDILDMRTNEAIAVMEEAYRRLGTVIAERKRTIQMKRGGLRRLPDGTSAACLPFAPSGHDINAVTTALLDARDRVSNPMNRGFSAQAIFETQDGGWNKELEDYMRSFIKARVIREWPLWQKPMTNQPATSNCQENDVVNSYAGVTDFTTLQLAPALRRNSRRTRRAPRRSQRKSRKQRGGAKQKRRVQRGGANFFTITIDTIPKSERSYQLVLTTKGLAMNPADVKNPNPSSTSNSLTDLFMRVILKENTSASAGTSVASRFRPLDASDVGTYDKLMNMYDTMMQIQEGPSLGAYRAFSLLSALEPSAKSNRAYTYVCKDKMAGRKATNEVQYATLESLYLDLQDSEKPDRDALARAELKAEVDKFVADATYTGTSPTTFSDLTISNVLTQDQLSTFCGAQGVAVSPTNVVILRKGHQKLRALYDAHIDWVRDFVMKHFMIIRPSDKQLVLNPTLAFPKTAKGDITTIQKQLEILAEKVRTRIAKYYRDVETVYASALQGLTSPY